VKNQDALQHVHLGERIAEEKVRRERRERKREREREREERERKLRIYKK
jgi:hypothetical protein